MNILPNDTLHKKSNIITNTFQDIEFITEMPIYNDADNHSHFTRSL